MRKHKTLLKQATFIAGAFDLQAKRKFERGPNACYYCSSGHHQQCRGVKLDCSVCSCSCSASSDIRAEIDAQQSSAKDSGASIPTPLDCLKQVKEVRLKRFLQ